MFDPDTHMIYHRQHHQELVDEASQRKLAQLAYHGRDKSYPRHYETLAALGRQLVNWGEQLQARYDTVELVISGENAQ